MTPIQNSPRLGRLAGAFVITALTLGTLMILIILTGVAQAQGKDITAHLIHLRQDDKE